MSISAYFRHWLHLSDLACGIWSLSGGGTWEQLHGKNVAEVASEAGVNHLIYSSLLHVTETTNGHIKHVVHLDDKAEVERYIRSSDYSLQVGLLIPCGVRGW
ncbi:hypothetical protein INS49_004039 [Diaporthe citri]|uniref:uncharacterized protein n=1 Tax=Diaporthe citri TaxID=83186 RepID=UPI001C80E1B3|nr:uncharacterized protein INS49_004039 [Diaporthe citri]KAG6354958.1 hypothetical protein INS49_004039 [Diaporthe citri]